MTRPDGDPVNVNKDFRMLQFGRIVASFIGVFRNLK